MKIKLRERMFLTFLLACSLSLSISTKTYADDSANKILYCPQEYIAICDEMQEKYGVSSSLLIAIIQHESSCRPNVVSSEGAVGLMQIHPVNNPNGLDLTDPRTNIELGTQVLLGWRDFADNDDLLLVLALYEGRGNSALRNYNKENWDSQCFDYAQEVLNTSLQIDKIRYGQ